MAEQLHHKDPATLTPQQRVEAARQAMVAPADYPPELKKAIEELTNAG